MRMRAGDLMVTTTMRAELEVLDFGDIPEATKVMSDDSCNPPWETCDGLENNEMVAF